MVEVYVTLIPNLCPDRLGKFSGCSRFHDNFEGTIDLFVEASGPSRRPTVVLFIVWNVALKVFIYKKNEHLDTSYRSRFVHHPLPPPRVF